MSLMSLISSQLIDVLQWTEDGPGVLAWRYPTAGHAIQTGSSLTVRRARPRCSSMRAGLRTFGPGSYTLNTQTLPVMTALESWDRGFRSPSKSDVVFFSMRDQTDQRWGTAQPITVRDRELGPLRIRANGVYSYRVHDVAVDRSLTPDRFELGTIEERRSQGVIVERLVEPGDGA